MLYHNLKHFYRKLINNPSSIIITTIGLTIGLATFMLVYSFVQSEESYDSFFPNADLIYRVTTEQKENGKTEHKFATTYGLSAHFIESEIPEVINATVTYQFDELSTELNNLPIYERGVIAADSNFIRFFQNQVIFGNKNTMLKEPLSIVLTEKKAKQYFGNQNPIDQEIKVYGSIEGIFTVTGVIENPPKNTHYQFDMIISINSIQLQLERHGWSGFNYYSYIKINENADIEAVANKISDVGMKYLGKESPLHFGIQRIVEIHLDSSYSFEPSETGSMLSLKFLKAIAWVILTISFMNYMSYSISHSLFRTKEITIKKVMGASRMLLHLQLMIEVFIISLISAIITLLFLKVIWPTVAQLIGLNFGIWSDTSQIFHLFIISSVGGIIAGAYPSFILSATKTNFQAGSIHIFKRTLIWRWLVIIQLAITFVLVVSAFVMKRQLTFMINRSVGIETENVIALRNPQYDREKAEAHKNQLRYFVNNLKSFSGIKSVATISNIPGGDKSDVNSTSGKINIEGIGELVGTSYTQHFDHETISTLKLKINRGRGFRENDTYKVMANMAFLNHFKINQDNIIGSSLHFGDNPSATRYEVIGIIDDFHRTSFKSRVEPTLYFYSEALNNTVIRVDGNQLNSIIKYISKYWKSSFPHSPLEIIELGDNYQSLYQNDLTMHKIIKIFTSVGLSITSIGLIGLLSFNVRRKIKEIAVRKIMGASSFSIIVQTLKNQLSSFLTVIIIGITTNYFILKMWLENYAYRINYPWLLNFLCLILIGLFIIVITVIVTYKYSVANPVKTLKNVDV